MGSVDSGQWTIGSVDSGQWTVDSKRLLSIPLDYSAAVKIKKGYHMSAKPQTVFPDDKGIIYIEIKELGRLEIHFSKPVLNVSPLPIGSTFDKERGIFYWQAGPGFIGDYRFVFVEKQENGRWLKRNIKIKVSSNRH